MAESEDYWADFGDTMQDLQSLLYWVKGHEYMEINMTKAAMDSLIVELKFLQVFVGYAHRWSDASSLSSHDADMDSQFIKVAAAANKLKSAILYDVIPRYRHVSISTSKLTKQLSWYRKYEHLLNDPWASLIDAISPLRIKIFEAYYSGSLSNLSFRPHPPPSGTTSFAWLHFYRSLQSILLYLSEETLFLSDPLRLKMKALACCLNSLSWLLSGDDYDWSPWRDNMLAHFGGKMVELAHFCCRCWYASIDAPMSQITEQDLVNVLSDLQSRMDTTSPDSLEVALGFLGHYVYDGKDSERSISSFVYYIQGVRDERDILHKELVSLLTYFIQVPEVDNTDRDVSNILVRIKDVVKEARNLKYRYQVEHYTSYAVMLAKIWSLKAEIFVKSSGPNGALLTLNLKDDLVETLQEGYRYLAQICYPTNENSAEYQISLLLEGLPQQVESLYMSSHDDENYLVSIKVRNFLSNYLAQIMILKANELLLDLLENDASLMLTLKHKVATLRGGLFFLKYVLANKMEENTEEDKVILMDIQVVVTGVISLCNAFSADNLTEEVIQSMDAWLLDLLEKGRQMLPNFQGPHLQIPRLRDLLLQNIPKTPRLSFIELVLQNLGDLLNLKQDSLANTTHDIRAIHIDLEYIVSACQNVFEKEECKDLHTQVSYLAYQLEHVIESMLVENKAELQKYSLWLYHLSKEIRDIKMQLVDFDLNIYNHGIGDSNVPPTSRLFVPITSQITPTIIEEVMVGLHDQKEQIIGRLTKGTQQRDIVSIVGMAGIGKTTLANNVFCSPIALYHFSICAWCRVSQNYKRRDLLLDILSYIINITDNIHIMSDADLAELLYKRLKGKRYLIVMDDLWSTRPWDDLQLSFPNDSNSSRILLTSRLQDVVSKISDPYPLGPLSEVESWKLLNMKIFREKECPRDLLEIGQQIAKNCKGLPLAIGAIAGLLERTCGMSQDLWKQIATSVSSHILNDPETQCKRILELSYDHLPEHLKACFLYLGAFSEDKDIPVRRLQWLWIAEGFVRKLEFSKSLEDIAEDYLMDLVGRSLVIVAKRRSNGKVKACRIHDVVRDLCLLKAKDDSFLQMISANDEPYSSFDALRYGALYERFNASNCITYWQYRLYFCTDREQFVVSRPRGEFVRSLIFSAATDMSPRCSYDVSFIYTNFERLRVLNLESINMGSSFGNGIELLFHLRYLAVCGDMESIPPSVSKLRNLETFFIKGLKRKVILPHTIWEMTKLRHLHVSNYLIIALPNDKNVRSFQLDSLVTLSLPYFSLGEETNEIILKFPNLRRLKCVFSEAIDHSCRVPSFESLLQLESLKISYYAQAPYGGELKLPSGLKELTLSNICLLSYNRISQIGGLQNLEVLKLVSCSLEGSSNWDMTEREFLKLKYLELDNLLDFVHWNAGSDHLPQLQELVLRNCEQLQEVPFDFVYISTLEKIEVQLCGVSVNQSVKRIEEEEIEGLKIVVNNSYSA